MVGLQVNEGILQKAEKPARAPRQRKAVMSISERAAERVKELMAKKEPPPAGLRIGVRTRGYGLSFHVVSCLPSPGLLSLSNRSVRWWTFAGATVSHIQ